MKLKPRYYQLDAFNDFFDYIPDHPGKHPLIVLPTGSGKSLVQAMIVEKMLEYPNTRVLLITHQQELIKQNYSELTDNLDEQLLDIGIYSAGLGLRDTRNRIMFAGIQSVHKRAWELGYFDLIMVDEAHRIPAEKVGTYRNFLAEMTKINKNIVIAGLSATPYRMKTGLLCEGKDKIFDDICHTTTIPELIKATHFKNKDKTQYLSEIISKNAVARADMSGVHIRGGEYIPGEMEKAFLTGDLVCRAVNEIAKFTADRKKILVFTAGIAHCEDVTEKMNAIGLDARCIHSQKSDAENQSAITDFREGRLKYLVNVDILTTGFNEKAIDCICMLRSTRSPGLYYQIAGRGLRMFPGKENCLFLDFGGNILLHGPIDKIEVRKAKDGTREVQTAPMKECPQCQQLLFLAVTICPTCGYQFPTGDKHEDTASDADILSKWKKPTEYDVKFIAYTRHQKIGKPDSLRVSYYHNDFQSVDEFICIEHDGYAKQKAQSWFAKRHPDRISSVAEALNKQTEFRNTTKIIVDFNDRFPRIIGYTFGESVQSPEKEINDDDIPF